jgi:hypothetical protein
MMSLQEEWECQQQPDPLEQALNEIINKGRPCWVSRFEEQIEYEKTCEQENKDKALAE